MQSNFLIHDQFSNLHYQSEATVGTTLDFIQFSKVVFTVPVLISFHHSLLLKRNPELMKIFSLIIQPSISETHNKGLCVGGMSSSLGDIPGKYRMSC